VGRYPVAVFLDRDGTINVDSHYAHDPAALELIPRAAEGLRFLSQLPVHIIVATNQAGIALGYFTESDMAAFHEALRGRVRELGARIDAFYYCPHFEPVNVPSGVAPCACSKPAPGMLIEAASDFGLSLSGSFMIGDKTSDVAAGGVVGCTTVLLKTGKAGGEHPPTLTEPDYVRNDLDEAAHLVGQFMPSISNPHLAQQSENH
jgi:D-glycero-D-manno-heptose 1,7-bisphosphate phosphatase